MNVNILHLQSGAEKAKGYTVIIDVFRAFTMEACLFHQGAEKIYAVADAETAYKLKEQHPDYILIGERHGKILPGFEYGNSPYSIRNKDFTGRTFIHTTTNGTQGLDASSHADVIMAASLVNARATADYILRNMADTVSLVCMGWEGHDTEEDILCAEYMKSILDGRPLPDIEKRAYDLRFTEGKKFFDPEQRDVFPEGDFHICISHDLFDFAIISRKEDGFLVNRKVKTDG